MSGTSLWVAPVTLCSHPEQSAQVAVHWINRPTRRGAGPRRRAAPSAPSFRGCPDPVQPKEPIMTLLDQPASLTYPQVDGELPGPLSARLLERQQRRESNARTYPRHLPIAITEA